ncbi:MAG: MlaD family protein [Solirubrobacteraceae bacterium]
MSQRGSRPSGRRVDRNRRIAALATIGLIALVTFIIFAKPNPFANPFQLTARFTSAAQLSQGSEVRIAGIQVGQVSAITAGPGHTAAITMSIGDAGLPVHSDATLTVRPRLALEGNAYIDLNPGTPSAPILHVGAVIPTAQTSISVQLDQLLDVLDVPTRSSLTTTMNQLARGLGSVAGARYPGSTSLRLAVRQLDRAVGPIGVAASAATGTSPGDLTRAVNSSADFTTQLAEDPTALADSVSNYNQFVGALAFEDSALAGTVGQFDLLMRTAAQPLTQLHSALPVFTRFASSLQPTLQAVPPAVASGSRLLQQIKLVVQPHQLPALLSNLTPVLSGLPTLERELQVMLSNARPVTDCITTHVVPSLSMTVPDGINSTNVPAYLDLVHAFAGLAGLGSDYDGNGGTVRLGMTTSERAIEGIIPGIGKVVGRLPAFSAVRPGYLGEHVNPPFRPDAPCAAQPLPNLNADQGTVPSYSTITSASAAAPPSPLVGRVPLTSPHAAAPAAAPRPAAAPAKPAQPPALLPNPTVIVKHLPGLKAVLQSLGGTTNGAAACLDRIVSGLGTTGRGSADNGPLLGHALASGGIPVSSCASPAPSGSTGDAGGSPGHPPSSRAGLLSLIPPARLIGASAVHLGHP